MKITSEPIGERQLSMTIEVDEQRVTRAQRRVARQISREINIPGFRRGKAPYSVIVQRLGQEVAREELVSVLAEGVYRDALEQLDTAPFAPGTLEETRYDPLTLTFIVPLAPEVELGDYRSYRSPFSGADVSEEALAQALEAIQQQNALLAPLDRPAAEGDLIVADLVGRAMDGSVFVQEEEARILLDPEASVPLPGLIEALIGVEPGDERTFTLLLPADFELEQLQAREAEFTAEVESVYERIVPLLDDDLARTVGNYDTFADLEGTVRQRLVEQERANAESEYSDRVLQDIVERAVVSFPPIMLDEALDDAVEAYEAQIERREHMLLEDYLRIQSKTIDDLRDELRLEVEQSIRRSLVLGEIVQQEDLTVSDEELERQIAESSERYGERAEEVRAALSTPEGRRDLRNRMLAEKAMQRLSAIAKGQAAEKTAAEDEPTEAGEPEESEN
ncbi:MAG: trigger factor [Anaerolineae bacterium]